MECDLALKRLRGGPRGIRQWNEWRAKLETSLADTPTALPLPCYLPDLSGVDLSHANLAHANLSAMNLAGARLIGTDLIDANLVFANLPGAILSCASLFQTNLVGVTLTDACLVYANISKTDLAWANLTNALLLGTVLVNVDLSRTMGLDQVRHDGPSSIGVDTIFRSDGKIPEVFLRGCGVPDNLITDLPSLIGEPIQSYSCFISYSHKDMLFARQLYDTLQDRGIRCWLDKHELLPGDNIYKGVEEGIRIWDKTLLCASEHSLTSGWVDDEITHAFAKEKKLFEERKQEVLALVPLNLDGYIFDSWKHPKKNLIVERLAADFTNWKSDADQFSEQVERVIKALALTRKPPPQPKL